jgi:phenylpropionate dioxygenase-like ring-hydroxylating dioxygenase large terminal subunit
MSLRSVLSLVKSDMLPPKPSSSAKYQHVADKMQSWILAMHSSRFKKAGDYFRLDIAGFPIILIQGKDGTIQAFHNACRHRAYPIVNKDSGSSLVLGKFTFHPEAYSCDIL